jgi:hypothetical protein
MYGKLGDILLDLIKYVATVAVLYPFLQGFPKNDSYYILVSTSLVVLTAIGLCLHHWQKKQDKRQNNDQNNNVTIIIIN